MIDSVHRRMLRKVLDIKWPEVINNNELYDTTKEGKWSYIIKGRKLSWLGHLMRLDVDTPARKALIEFCKPVKKVIGKHRQTWVETIKKDLQNIRLNLDKKNDNVYFEQLAKFCENRKLWKDEVKYMMLNTTYM